MSSTLYIGNASKQNLVACVNPVDYAFGYSGPFIEIPVPAGTVASRTFTDSGISQLVANQLSAYFPSWAGSGIGWSIDTPITL